MADDNEHTSCSSGWRQRGAWSLTPAGWAGAPCPRQPCSSRRLAALPRQHVARGRLLPWPELLLSQQGSVAAAADNHWRDFKFLVSVFNDCRNRAPRVYFHIPLPALLITPTWSQLCSLSKPRSSLPCQPEAPPQAALSVTFCLPPHLPHCLPLLQHQQSWQLLPKLAQKRHLAGT